MSCPRGREIKRRHREVVWRPRSRNIWRRRCWRNSNVFMRIDSSILQCMIINVEARYLIEGRGYGNAGSGTVVRCATSRGDSLR